jgi:protein phosphatase methylesterase 1
VQTLSEDVAGVLTSLYGDNEHSRPPVVVVGHSMGGALAAHLAAAPQLPGVAAVVVIDVVEGTAMASLPHMKSVLERRPKAFGSLDSAVSP